MYYDSDIYFEMSDLITHKYPAQWKKYDSMNLKYNEQEKAVNMLLSVIAYNEYFIVMWWWRKWRERVFWARFHISVLNMLKEWIYPDGFKFMVFWITGFLNLSIVWYSEQQTFQKPDIFDPLVRRWNGIYSVWIARKK